MIGHIRRTGRQFILVPVLHSSAAAAAAAVIVDTSVRRHADYSLFLSHTVSRWFKWSAGMKSKQEGKLFFIGKLVVLSW